MWNGGRLRHCICGNRHIRLYLHTLPLSLLLARMNGWHCVCLRFAACDIRIRPRLERVIEGAGAKAKKAERVTSASAAARSSLAISLPQCAALSDLLCSKHSCILPTRCKSLSISHLCHLLSPLASHPDLLSRWKAALHTAVDALCSFRNIPPINWRSLSENILEPSIRKPLRLQFLVTCLDLSWNVNGVISVRMSTKGSPDCSFQSCMSMRLHFVVDVGNVSVRAGFFAQVRFLSVKYELGRIDDGIVLSSALYSESTLAAAACKSIYIIVLAANQCSKSFCSNAVLRITPPPAQLRETCRPFTITSHA
jgi:hypothetical protein